MNNQPSIVDKLSHTHELNNPDSCSLISPNGNEMKIWEKSNCIPPNPLTRNEFGLIENINYQFQENGFVDWRKLIKKEYLTPNTQYFKNDELEKIKKGEIDILSLEDNKLLILLSGIKEVAQLRGYTKVDYRILYASDHNVSLACTIDWIPNYETNNCSVSFTSTADACFENTKGLGKIFLTSVAENRAFTRAVRNFLNIHICGEMEISTTSNLVPTDTNNAPPEIYDILKDALKNLGVNSFVKFKNKMIKEDIDGANIWEKFEDIPKAQVFELITLSKNIFKKKDDN